MSIGGIAAAFFLLPVAGLAWRAPLAISLGLAVAIEVALALIIRDNLTLNILMLVHPLDAVRAWQAGG